MATTPRGRESRGVSERCIICDHPMGAHIGLGCQTDSFLRGRCDCDFFELPPLPRPATAAQHRARADWWLVRAEMAETRLRRTRIGSERWWRLDRFIDMARTAHAHGLEMASALESAADPGDDLLDLIGIESIASRPGSTLDLVLERLEHSDDAARDTVRARLEAEFDTLQPRRRRELLEDDALRGFLQRVGVVSAWSVSVTEASSLDPAHPDPLPGSSGCRTDAMRGNVERYWRDWAQAPRPQIHIAYIAMDPDEFKQYLALAIETLTPAERSRFTNRNQLNCWIVSGMRPLFEDGHEVPLHEVIDEGYRPTTAL